ncbi:UbiA family prenyltransferase [Nocardiopsis sp. RSe5-2]|uniref:UbiA family prenyltransferase n=1 Tax=Nocardiopsis endophytica TaxID=3018445 RepID=A0ABT4U8P7_9ACTN|nr:UbiA family prenyltransferase [Nocardiopsis endophytica]MDA2813333.1 UbiA family prenyltransferase [Nocardiopsis endophytica]
MSTSSEGIAQARPGLLEHLGRYARLIKFKFVLDFYLSLVIVATLLGPAGLAAPGALTALGLFAVGMLGVLSAVMTLDDVTGAKDGSDSANYAGSENTALRPLKRKPLLTGELSVRQAQVYGYACLAWGALWWAAAVLLAPDPALWAVVVTALLLTLSVQYSWGLKLSYYGLGEAVLLFSASAFLIAPYGLATGELPVLVLAQGLLFGFGQLLIAGYSNTNDREGDAAAGRRTVAVLTSARGNAAFLGALTAANLLVVLVPVAAGAVTPWFAAALLPFAAVRLHQYAGFLRTGDPLPARSLGIKAFRTLVVCLVAFNLIRLAL